MATPSYPLVQVRAQVKILGRKAFSASALNAGRSELGLSSQKMIDLILGCTDKDCFKSMPNNSIAGAMQDVYHLRTPSGKIAYVKFCLHQCSKVVVSFKER